MKSRFTLVIAILWQVAVLACGAQDAPPAQATVAPRLSTGTVTGTVYCADSDLPARLAVVNLVQTVQYEYAVEDTATTDLDGRFAFRASGRGPRSGRTKG